MTKEIKDRAVAQRSDTPQKIRISGRRSVRVPMRVRAALIVGTGSNHRRHEITTVDSCEHGLGITIDHVPLCPGQVVQVILAEDFARAGRYRVVWVAPPGSARSGEAGIELVSAALAQF